MLAQNSKINVSTSVESSSAAEASFSLMSAVRDNAGIAETLSAKRQLKLIVLVTVFILVLPFYVMKKCTWIGA